MGMTLWFYVKMTNAVKLSVHNFTEKNISVIDWILNTLRRTCSYTAMGLLVKVIALQKLACLLTVFWVRSMTIWVPLALGWNRIGLMGRPPPMVPHWIGRHLLCLWRHRCDVDGNWPPRESGRDRAHREVSVTAKWVLHSEQEVGFIWSDLMF